LRPVPPTQIEMRDWLLDDAVIQSVVVMVGMACCYLLLWCMFRGEADQAAAAVLPLPHRRLMYAAPVLMAASVSPSAAADTTRVACVSR